MVGNMDRLCRAIGSSVLAMDSGGISMSGGFGMTTLGGEPGGLSSWRRHIGRRIERGRVRVFESFVCCVFVCGGPAVFVHRWMAWWSASITKSQLLHAM